MTRHWARAACTGIIGAAIMLAATLMAHVQSAPPQTTRTEKGLYRLRVVEPGYDVTVTETSRAATHSVLEMTGVVPTITAGGTVLFRAIYDIAREREFTHVFAPPPDGLSENRTTRTDAGRQITVTAQIYMTKDPKTPLKDLMGAAYSAEAQAAFDPRGYMPIATLAKLFGK
jgi:hypothetical protein